MNADRMTKKKPRPTQKTGAVSTATQPTKQSESAPTESKSTHDDADESQAPGAEPQPEASTVDAAPGQATAEAPSGSSSSKAGGTGSGVTSRRSAAKQAPTYQAALKRIRKAVRRKGAPLARRVISTLISEGNISDILWVPDDPNEALRELTPVIQRAFEQIVRDDFEWARERLILLAQEIADVIRCPGCYRHAF